MDGHEFRFTEIGYQLPALAAAINPCMPSVRVKPVNCVKPEVLTSLHLACDEPVIAEAEAVSPHGDTNAFLGPVQGHRMPGLMSVRSIKNHSKPVEACSEVVAWPGRIAEFDVKLRRLLRVAKANRCIEHKRVLKANITGESGILQQVLSEAALYSRCDAPVVIAGATHYIGMDEKPFAGVDCGAVPGDLVENELLDRVRGASSDARHSPIGRVENPKAGHRSSTRSTQ